MHTAAQGSKKSDKPKIGEILKHSFVLNRSANQANLMRTIFYAKNHILPPIHITFRKYECI
jgi:hypothetical protein